MTERRCRACGQWHDLATPWPAACAWHFGQPGARSGLPAPMLIRDGMEPTRNMADGQLYESKRAYQKAVRAAGCEIVGNERVEAKREAPQGVGQSISEAIDKLQAGYVPGRAADG